jgi:hypothetical protein
MRAQYTLTALIALTSLIGSAAAQVPAGTAPTAEERVTAIKQNLAHSQQSLRQYTWTETTAVMFKGEEKSKKVNSCAYGADGKVVKTEMAAPAEAEGKRGIRGKVVENKKEEMAAYTQSAVALIKSYVPPDPAKIQACKDAGKMTMTVIEPGKRAKIDFKDYEKPGDNLGVEIDLTTNQILGLSVASYLADAKDAVSLNVAMATLPDGTGHPATIKIDMPAKNMAVAVTNSAYQKKAN